MAKTNDAPQHPQAPGAAPGSAPHVGAAHVPNFTGVISGPPPASDATITTTATELQAMVARLVAAELAAREPEDAPLPPPLGPSGRPMPKNYEDMTLDERVSAELANERPKAPPLDYIPCVSRASHGGTGATFVAGVIPESRTRKGRVVPARVVQLYHYERPVGWDRAHGPSNPFGLPEGYDKRLPNGQFTHLAKAYIYERFWLADMKAILQKPLNPAYVMTPEEAKTAGLTSAQPTGGQGVGYAAEEDRT